MFKILSMIAPKICPIIASRFCKSFTKRQDISDNVLFVVSCTNNLVLNGANPVN